MSKPEAQYRLVVFEAVEDPQAVRDLFCRVTGMHPTDAMQWVARAPGTWPRPLAEAEVRGLLDGLFELGVPAEAWRLDTFPELAPARTIHDAACLADGFRVHGLRGEPTHWVPWNKVELISAGTIAAEDEYRSVAPPGWVSALSTGLNAMLFRRAVASSARRARAQRLPRDPVGEVLIVRCDPRIAFRIVEDKMNYGYLGDRRSLSASENFRVMVADLVARSDDAYITPATKAFLAREDGGHEFPSSHALLDYTTHRLLWSWYRRDRESGQPLDS